MSEKYSISTYGRSSFKQCRQLWDFTSSLRLGYTTDKPPYHFTFGEAWHRSMETLYEPGDDYQTDARTKAAKIAFETVVRAQYREIVRFGNDSTELDAEYDKMLELGPRMVDYYVGWAKIHDEFEPVTVEHDFEVPVLSVSGRELLVCGTCKQFGGSAVVASTDCEHDGRVPIVYSGRIDGLVRDYRGKYWVLEHKSAEKEGATWWLQINDQVSSYEWAMQERLGIPIKGTIYTIAYKRAPERPKILTKSDGSVSCDKRQQTTASLFVEAVEEAHPFRPAHETISENEKYFNYHQFLANPNVAPKFVERHKLHRNPNQLKDVGRRIAMEAEDMLNDPYIYPNITSINCNKCPFRSPCMTRQDGGDWKYELASNYPKRDG